MNIQCKELNVSKKGTNIFSHCSSFSLCLLTQKKTPLEQREHKRNMQSAREIVKTQFLLQTWRTFIPLGWKSQQLVNAVFFVGGITYTGAKVY